MINARRSAHRRIFVAIAILLPLLFASALWLRPEVPPLSPTDRKLLAEAGFPSSRVAAPAQARSVAADAASFELAFEAGPDGEHLLSMRPIEAIPKPDLLVYWAPTGAAALGAGSILLGHLAGTSRRRLALPSVADEGAGDVVVYSLAHAEVVARFALEPTRAGAAE